MRLGRLLSWWPSERMLRLACLFGLVAILLMVFGVLSGQPLPVIASMSVAQGFGVLAGLMYAVSIVAEAGRGPKGP